MSQGIPGHHIKLKKLSKLSPEFPKVNSFIEQGCSLTYHTVCHDL